MRGFSGKWARTDVRTNVRTRLLRSERPVGRETKNAKKNPFFGVLGQKGRFWTIFGKKGAIFEFSVKKRKRHFFTSFFNTKNQKILMRRFSGKWART